MKTIKELFKEINNSEEIRKEFCEAKDKDSFEKFLKSHGCPMTADEFSEAVSKETDIELPDELADMVAGGAPVDASYYIYLLRRHEFEQKRGIPQVIA